LKPNGLTAEIPQRLRGSPLFIWTISNPSLLHKAMIFQAFAIIPRLQEPMHPQTHAAPEVQQPVRAAVDADIDVAAGVPLRLRLLGRQWDAVRPTIG